MTAEVPSSGDVEVILTADGDEVAAYLLVCEGP
jgi:hypothetical protein